MHAAQVERAHFHLRDPVHDDRGPDEKGQGIRMRVTVFQTDSWISSINGRRTSSAPNAMI